MNEVNNHIAASPLPRQPSAWWRRVLAAAVAQMIVIGALLLTGVRARWTNNRPQATPTLYFANHCSHGDFVLLWATLPRDLRKLTRPVAGEDYWLASRLRRFIGKDVFNALMIRRDGIADATQPVQQIGAALRSGDSLIMFPEGTRNTGDTPLLPFKSGLYHLAQACPQARLVPVWINNLKRVLPKGMLIPVPLACTVHYGEPIAPRKDEDKTAFLARARQAMLDLRPLHDQDSEQQTSDPHP